VSKSLVAMGQDIYRRHGIAGLSGAAFNYFSRPIVMPFAIRSLRRAATRSSSVTEFVDLALTFRLGNVAISPMQVRSEIVALCGEVARLKPATVLEIGTAKGGTLFLWGQLAAPDAHLISVDLPFGQFGGGYPPFKVPFYRSFARANQRIDLIRGDSHDPKTFGQITAALAGRLVDFLFIDGDHSFDGVSADYEMYRPLVSPDGLIAFHDIVHGEPDAVGEVPRFWQQLKSREQGRHEIVEFVENWKQGGLGIGVIRCRRPS
jgi:cephalosporin hydroxylase